MNKTSISVIFFLILTLAVRPIYGQKLKQFGESKEAYLADLQSLLKEIEKRKEKIDSTYNNFAITWSEDEMWKDEERKAVVLASNNLLRKRINEFGDWDSFLGIVAHMKNQEDEAYFLPWLKDFAEVARRSTKRIIIDYLGAHKSVFFKNELFNDGTIRWSFDGAYDFSFEKGQATFFLEDVLLEGFFKDDSTAIENTTGTYTPKDFLFKGKGGKVYWTRNGLSADSAYANLNSYELQANKSSFAADSVVLNTLFYFNEPILGRFEERMSSRNGDIASFPRFTSYRKDLTLTDIVPDVDFSGGAGLIGNRFFGLGANGQGATLFFKFQGEPIIKARANQFWLRKDLFATEAAVVSIKLENDSMYHPKSSVRFFVNRRTLSINRSNEGMSRKPYSNSYHAMDIFFESLTWKLDDPQFHLGNLNMGTVTPVVFESQQYFRAERFEAISGLDHVNPLYKIQKVGAAFNRREIAIEEMARSLGMSTDACHRFMMEMSIQGFVDYDKEVGKILLKDKIWDYTNNWEEKRDYDVIRFVSGLETGTNASVSLLSYDMEIRGIDRIALSDSQQVYLYPKGGKVNMHKGLDFDFDGKIIAGRFSFFGDQFFFNYDQFQINMANIDSMRFKVESFTPDRMGNRPLVDVKNVLQNINGELLVDKPNNKSGKESHTIYPIFKSGKGASVYYDRPDVFGGVYNRESFFIEIEPFEIDSLDNTSTEGLFFNGVFTSAGIFQDMFQEIRVQDDYSLGFTTFSPTNGFSAYGGKGTFKNELRLDNRGLRGDGEIEYLSSRAIGDKFLFFPDSVNGEMSSYTIDKKEGANGHPSAFVSNALLHWEPLNDVMYSTNRETPFEMYDDVDMFAKGELALSPSGLNGKGRLDFLDAQTDSKAYTFRPEDFESPALDFRVRAHPTGDWAFQLTNAKSTVNFTKENGEFTLNDPANFFEFPINQYNAFMDFAEWLIPEKAVEVKKRGQEPSSLMLSVHPKQDSLQFIADRAKFFLTPSRLEVFEANEIDVADARIFPDTGYVVIDTAADMRVLENAIVLATRDNKYHQFLGASIKVKGRYDYSGSGDYEYFDEDNTPWLVFFEEIKVDRRTRHTVGRANVKEEDGFFLSPFFAYYGRVELTAPEQHLRFNGYTLIQQTCENIQTTWFKFNSVIDPLAIVIDLPTPEEAAGKRLFNGIYISNDSTSGYSAFLSQESNRAALELLSATGVLTYNKEKFLYIITTRERLENPDAIGNYLALNNKDCITIGEGLLSFGDKTGQVKLEGYGNITHDLKEDFIETNVALTFNFPFLEDILKLMSNAILDETSFAGVKIDNPAYKYALKAILTDKERAKYEEEVALYGAPHKLPKSLRNTIVLNQLYLYWNKETNSFFSEGEIGVGSILEVQVNKLVPGQIELQRKRKGDELFLYFEVDEKTSYYYQYRKNLMQFYSEDKEAMQLLMEMDPKKRTIEGKDGEPSFIFNQTTKGRMNRFLNRLEEIETQTDEE